MVRGEGTIWKEVPAMARQVAAITSISPRNPCYLPTLHYQNGGILIDANTATTVLASSLPVS